MHINHILHEEGDKQTQTYGIMCEDIFWCAPVFEQTLMGFIGDGYTISLKVRL